MYNLEKFSKVGKITAISLGTATIIAGSGYLISNYFRKSDCDIKERHFHVYQYKYDNIKTIYDSERINLHGYRWTDEIVPYSDSQAEKLDFLEKKKLVSIYTNQDFLADFMVNHQDYNEYEYEYKEREIDHYDDNDKPVYRTVTKKAYSKDSEVSHKTGNARVVHTNYYAYKIETNDKGKKVEIKSELTDNIFDVMELYPYFKVNSFIEITYTPFQIEIENDSSLIKWIQNRLK